MILEETTLPTVLEALLLAAGKPLSEDELLAIFSEHEKPSKGSLRQALTELKNRCETEARSFVLVEVASGFQFQVKPEWATWVARLWEEKAPRYSRALFETLALIAYKQPITRGDIEDIRGVSISPSIFKTLLDEREWIRVVGHREVPGRPALYATTKGFLDYFGLKNLTELPSLPEILNLEDKEPALQAAEKQLSLEFLEEIPKTFEEKPEAASEREEISEAVLETVSEEENLMTATISATPPKTIAEKIGIDFEDFEIALEEVSEALDAE